MLSTAKTDTLCTVFHCICCISRCICIGAYLKSAEGIRPCHDTPKVSADFSFLRLNISIINLAGGTIQRNIISLMISISTQFKYLVNLINGNLTTAGYATGSHSSCNYCCMRSHTATHCQNTLRSMHSLDIFRRGLQSNQNDSLTLFMSFLGFLCCKVYLTCRCSGRCGKSLSDYVAVLKRFRIKGGMQKLI